MLRFGDSAAADAPSPTSLCRTARPGGLRKAAWRAGARVFIVKFGQHTHMGIVRQGRRARFRKATKLLLNQIEGLLGSKVFEYQSI
jgi:hypothetical protein